jgi:hypothetical protein
VQVPAQAAAFLLGRRHQLLAGPADVHCERDRVPGRGDLADNPVQQPHLARAGRPAFGTAHGQRADRLAREDQGEPVAFTAVGPGPHRRLTDLDADKVQPQRPPDGPGYRRQHVIQLGGVLQTAPEPDQSGVRIVPVAVHQAGGPPAQHPLDGQGDGDGRDDRDRLADGAADDGAHGHRYGEVDGQDAYGQPGVDQGPAEHLARVEEPVAVDGGPRRAGQRHDAEQFGREVVVAVPGGRDDDAASPPGRGDEPPGRDGEPQRGRQRRTGRHAVSVTGPSRAPPAPVQRPGPGRGQDGHGHDGGAEHVGGRTRGTGQTGRVVPVREVQQVRREQPVEKLGRQHDDPGPHQHPPNPRGRPPGGEQQQAEDRHEDQCGRPGPRV